MEPKKLVRPEVRELEGREYAPNMEQIREKCDLSLNINPCGISKKVLEKLSHIDSRKINHYYPENTELIEEISSYTGVGVGQIMLGDGCDGCLGLIANTFINKGDTIIIPTPTFHRYEFHSSIMGGAPLFVPMKNFEMSSADILSSSNGAKIIFLCNPNNPTGKGIHKNILEEIIRNFRGIVVVDEALADVTAINGFELSKKYNNLIFVRSFSKAFGLASLRIGYIISNQDLINEIKKTSSPFKVNGIAQELSVEALRDREYIRESKDHIDKNRAFLINSLHSLGFACTASITTNFLVDVSKINTDSKIVVELLNKHGVLVTDAAVFRVPDSKYIRVAIGTENENKKFIEVMSSLSKKFSKSP